MIAMTPKERAQRGLKDIEQAITELLVQHGDWMSRPEIARTLDIESSDDSGYMGFLSGGMCKALVAHGVLEAKGGGGPGQTNYYRIKH